MSFVTSLSFDYVVDEAPTTFVTDLFYDYTVDDAARFLADLLFDYQIVVPTGRSLFRRRREIP